MLLLSFTTMNIPDLTEEARKTFATLLTSLDKSYEDYAKAEANAVLAWKTMDDERKKWPSPVRLSVSREDLAAADPEFAAFNQAHADANSLRNHLESNYLNLVGMVLHSFVGDLRVINIERIRSAASPTWEATVIIDRRNRVRLSRTAGVKYILDNITDCDGREQGYEGLGEVVFDDLADLPRHLRELMEKVDSCDEKTKEARDLARILCNTEPKPSTDELEIRRIRDEVLGMGWHTTHNIWYRRRTEPSFCISGGFGSSSFSQVTEGTQKVLMFQDEVTAYRMLLDAVRGLRTPEEVVGQVTQGLKDAVSKLEAEGDR